MRLGIRVAILGSLLAVSGAASAAGERSGAATSEPQASESATAQSVGGTGAASAEQENTGPDVVGRLIDVSPAAETIRIRDPRTNYIVELQLQDETRLEIDGEPASLNALREGEPIRASFELVEDEMVARSVKQGKPQPREPSATGAVESPTVNEDAVQFEGPSPDSAGPNPVELEQ